MEQIELNKICAERLRLSIEASGKKNYEIANEAGFTPQHISKLVNAKARLTADTARILSNILHVKEDYLLGENDYPTHSDMYKSMLSEMQQREKTYIELLENYGYKIIGNGESEWKNVNIFREHIENFENDEMFRRITEAPYVKYVLLQSPNGSVKRLDIDRFKYIINEIEDYVKFKLESCFEQPQPFRTI